MKKYLLFLILLPFFGFAQQTPEFSFELYFEDAAGNRDTVTLGYDPNASDSIDLAFDSENIINVPWGDSLDVRVGDLGYDEFSWYNVSDYESPDTSTFLTKRKILRYACPSISDTIVPSPIINRLSLQIYTDSLPLTIRWNKTPFKGDENPYVTNCRERTSFFGEEYPTWDVVNTRTLLVAYDSIVIIKSPNDDVKFMPYFYEDYQIKSYSNNDKRIITLQFIFHGRNNLSIYSNDVNKINIYPNPIQKGQNINIDFDGEYSLFDTFGKQIQSGKVQNNQIATDRLQKGMYFLRLETNKTYYQTKIIVQ